MGRWSKRKFTDAKKRELTCHFARFKRSNCNFVSKIILFWLLLSKNKIFAVILVGHSRKVEMENGNASARDPSGFLSQSIGSRVTVKLNSGVVYKGKISSKVDLNFY